MKETIQEAQDVFDAKTPDTETVYLTALEEEKLTQLTKIQKDYLDKTGRLGDLTVALKVAEAEALQAYTKLRQSDDELMRELEGKYGKGFQLNGSEVIPGN